MNYYNAFTFSVTCSGLLPPISAMAASGWRRICERASCAIGTPDNLFADSREYKSAPRTCHLFLPKLSIPALERFCPHPADCMPPKGYHGRSNNQSPCLGSRRGTDAIATSPSGVCHIPKPMQGISTPFDNL